MGGRAKLTAAQVHERRLAREAKWAERFDAREARRIGSDIVATFVRHGFGSNAAVETRQRVERLLASDRAYRATERLRQIAQEQLEQGDTTNIRDAVLEPTPEQIAQAERDGAGFQKFTPRTEDGTVRTVTAYKRRDCPQAFKMMLAGVIDLEGYIAAKWYRDLYEATGLAGNIPSAQLGREVFVAPQSHQMFTEWQIDNQDKWRFVRRSITSRHLRLLDQMLLNDVPLKRATRAARAFHRDPKKGFREGIDQLVSARDELREP